MPRWASHPARRFFAPALSALLLAGVLSALRWRDPHVPGSWGVCPFLLVTGHPCPGCGGLRAVADLSRGRVLAAAEQNVVVAALVPVAVAVVAAWFVRRGRGRGNEPVPWVSRPAFLLVLVAAFGCLGVLRLAGAAAWLGPS